MPLYKEPDYICHYGVKGMKWGVINEKDKYFDPTSKHSIKKTLKKINKKEVLAKGTVNDLDIKINALENKKLTERRQKKINKLQEKRQKNIDIANIMKKGREKVIKYAEKNNFKITSQKVQQNAMVGRAVIPAILLGNPYLIGLTSLEKSQYYTTGHMFKVTKNKE